MDALPGADDEHAGEDARVVALLAMTVVRLGLWCVTLPLRRKMRNMIVEPEVESA